MKKLSAVLRSERGDLLVGALVSLIVVGIVMGASASFLVVAGKASITNSQSTSRTILLNSTLSDVLPRAADYTSSPSQLVTGNGVTVSIWREAGGAGSGTDMLHASAPRSDREDLSCAGPSSSPENCVTAQVPVRNDSAAAAPSYARLDLLPGTDGAKYRVNVPKGTTELQYVFKATAGEDPSTLTFTAGDKKTTVDIPEDGSGYYYGRLLVEPESTITVKTKGPAAYESGTFTVYEVPDAR